LRVQFRLHHSAALAALGMAAALSGCANVDFDSQQAWFAKPFQFVSQTGGYTFSELQESKQQQRPITANDLVNSNGSCPPPPAPPVAPQAASSPGVQAMAAPAPATPDSVLGGGIALGMSECDVVFRAGSPAAVQLGSKPNGDRTAVLTFNSGPRSGIYRFERGALVEMDAVAALPAPPKTAQKKSAKPAKSAKSVKPQNQT
jgi:hypothetical protein